MDELEFRAAIDLATDEALELADALAERIVADFGDGLGARELALDYQSKRREIRRLRRALKATVAG